MLDALSCEKSRYNELYHNDEVYHADGGKVSLLRSFIKSRLP